MIHNSRTVANILSDVNETIRSRNTQLSSTVSQPSLNLASISNTERFSSEATKKTKSLEYTNITQHPGLIVFFLFLTLFAVTAPLGKDKLVDYCIVLSYLKYLYC